MEMILAERTYIMAWFKPPGKTNGVCIYVQEFYSVHTFFTRIILQRSKAILFKTLIVLFQFDFILYLDKQLHEVIAFDVFPFPVVHSFSDHITKIL
jgi:hypothetical protein